MSVLKYLIIQYFLFEFLISFLAPDLIVRTLLFREESKLTDKPRVCYLVPSPSTHICLDFENTYGFEKNARYVLAEILSIQNSVS